MDDDLSPHNSMRKGKVVLAHPRNNDKFKIAENKTSTHTFPLFPSPRVACSKSVETLSYMANNWNVPVMSPVASADIIADKTVFPRLTRINPYMQSAFVAAVFTLLDKFSWENIGKER